MANNNSNNDNSGKYFDDSLEGKVESIFVNTDSVSVTIAQRYFNRFSDSYGMNLFKDTNALLKDVLDTDMVSAFCEKYLCNKGLYREEYYNPVDIVKLLKGIKGITVYDELWGNHEGYYSTHDNDVFTDTDFVWVIFTKEGEYIDNCSDDVYIVWMDALYCNNVGFSEPHCGKLNIEYSEFLDTLTAMRIELGYRGERWYSDNGYNFTQDDGKPEIDVDDMARKIFEYIDSELAKGYKIKVSSDIYGLTIMRNPQNINDNNNNNNNNLTEVD